MSRPRAGARSPQSPSPLCFALGVQEQRGGEETVQERKYHAEIV